MKHKYTVEISPREARLLKRVTRDRFGTTHGRNRELFLESIITGWFLTIDNTTDMDEEKAR